MPIRPPCCAIGFIPPCICFLSSLIAFMLSSSTSSSKSSDCSWLRPKTIRKQKETEETQLTSRLAISIPDWVRERNCCVIEKGTLARTKPAKKELIQAIAGMVVAIMTSMPFMLSIMPDWAAWALLRESTGGLSPLSTRNPFSGLQRNPLLQSKASLVSNMNFLLRWSHFSTMFLSLVSAQLAFLTAFLVLVKVPQSVQQNLKSWMQHVTQMIGRNTHPTIRSSRSNSPIYVDIILLITLKYPPNWPTLGPISNCQGPDPRQCRVDINQSQISIMAEGKQKLKEKGLDKLTFYCLPNKTVRVCRKTTPTWQDLLCELQTQTGFQANAIEVAINTEKVYYDGRTKLADIVIDQKDKLYVMCRPSFKSESQQKRYEADVIKKKQKCQQAIQSRNEQVEVLRLVSLMESNPDYAALLKELESQFGRIEAMIAIETSKGNRREALEFLKSGKAARSAQKIQRAQEEEYLKQLLNQPDQQALKQFIKKNKIDKIGYRGIVLKLYEKYPKFREYEPRHQKLVQQQLFGQVIDSDQSEVDVEPNNNLYYAIVGEILAKAQKQPKLAPQQRQAFIKRMLKEADASTVGAALAQADNNLAAAEEIIREGLVQQVQDFINTTRKSCKRNIVLQFFNRPDFDKIKTSLRGNRKKAQKFVDWVISENKNNLGFSSLFNKYKDYAVTLLSGETSLSNPEKLQKRSIKIYPQLSADQQAKIKKQVDKACNRELVEALRMHGFTAELAEAAVRAARNRPEELAPFLKIQAINQQFDFCPGGPQNEQLYIYLHYRKKRQLLKQLQDPSEMILWLSQLVVLRPLLYEMIVRNKPSFDSLVKRSQTAVK